MNKESLQRNTKQCIAMYYFIFQSQNFSDNLFHGKLRILFLTLLPILLCYLHDTPTIIWYSTTTTSQTRDCLRVIPHMFRNGENNNHAWIYMFTWLTSTHNSYMGLFQTTGATYFAVVDKCNTCPLSAWLELALKSLTTNCTTHD